MSSKGSVKDTSKFSKSQSFADQYAALFDNNWVQTQQSAMRAKYNKSRSYHPTSSWNGQSDNPKADRLETNNILSTSKPIIGLSGKAVIPLDGEVSLQVLNVPEPKNKIKSFPLTSLQKAVGMTTSIYGTIPIVEEAKRLNKVVIVEKEGGFSNGLLQPPTFVLVDPPKGLVLGGKHCDQKLLSPTQRLEVQEFERKKLIADAYLRRAEMDRGALYKQLHGPQYKRGITGLDSNNNEQSEVYGSVALDLKRETEYKDRIQHERRTQLAIKSSSMITNGNILVPESIDTNRVKMEKLYQRKGGSYHGLSFQETHNRLFCRNSVKKESNRIQYLRNHDLGGKQYNIVTHTAIEYWPSSSASLSSSYGIIEQPRPEHKILMHPSQTSLEGSRNLQGSLKPY